MNEPLAVRRAGGVLPVIEPDPSAATEALRALVARSFEASRLGWLASHPVPAPA